MKNGTNGNGKSHLLAQNKKKPVLPASAKPTSETQTTVVSFKTLGGISLSGIPLRINRHSIVFELYSPNIAPQFSESLEQFKIISHGREIYSGRAVIHSVTDADTKIICEATLDGLAWKHFNWPSIAQQPAKLVEEFKVFFERWQEFYKIIPEFKIVVVNMQAFLDDLRAWSEEVQLEINHLAEPIRLQFEIDAVNALLPSIVNACDTFIREFESITPKLDKEAHPAYRAYFRRQLHPYILASPFARRAFDKPLGYAGDYKMIEMMIQSPYQGKSLFAKIINVWLIGQLLTRAHQNRIVLLEQKILEETIRVKKESRPAKILSIGCGPAFEIFNFLKRGPICSYSDFTLLDFNQETLEYVQNNLKNVGQNFSKASCNFIKKSVMQIIKDDGQSLCKFAHQGFDYIYCAGLFDYLSDKVCKQLMDVFYAILAPNGLLLVTNAATDYGNTKPFYFSMDYILDWNLLYRGRRELMELVPKKSKPENVSVFSENTGTNLFLEIRKKNHV
jgi:extracellular factor (EF) 3-hydroxypalmitic acid methyl ester biosynthesis protein